MIASGALGCGDAVLVVVDGEREVPTELDALCLAIADRDPAGGAFGRVYRLEGTLGALPQSLAVEAGGAADAEAWVRGYLGGVEVARDRAGVDFGGDIELRLDRCSGGNPGQVSEAAAGPGTATLAVSNGRGGVVVVAVGDGRAAIIDAVDGFVEERPLDLGGATRVVALDADGDCDDDLVAYGPAGAQLFVRGADGFTAGEPITGDAVTAAAAADVDRDGDADLVLAPGPTLYRSDAAGGFTADAGAIPAGIAGDVTALVLGDLDSDSNPDLIAGQGGGAPRAFLADASGQGVFAAAPAILPDVGRDVLDLALVDLDADLDLDLAAAISADAARVYINRGGLLEDQSFVRLPQPAPMVVAVSAADWSCAADLALAGGSTTVYVGGEDGVFTARAEPFAATDVVHADLDDDGDLDVVLAGVDGVLWGPQ